MINESKQFRFGRVQIVAPPKVGPELNLIKVTEQNIEGKGLDLKLELNIFGHIWT